MRVTKGINKGVDSAIRALTKIFGINSDIYKPITFNDPAHGYFDSNIKWEETPYFTGKILAPFIFKKNNENLNIVSSFIDDAMALYVPSDIILTRHSLVVLHTKWGNANYVISDIKQIRDDERIVFSKYFVVPDKEFTLPYDKDKLIQKVEKPLPEWYVDEDIITEDDGEQLQSSNVEYKPLK